MPEWAAHLITALLSGGFVAALFKGILTARGQVHRQHRQDRADEFAAMQGVMDRLTADRDELKTEIREHKEWAAQELQKRDERIGRLTEDHTQCLVEQGRLKEREKIRDRRITALEEEIARLRGAGPEGR